MSEIIVDKLTDEQIEDADRRGLVTQVIARIARRPASIQQITARRMIADAINAAARSEK